MAAGAAPRTGRDRCPGRRIAYTRAMKSVLRSLLCVIALAAGIAACGNKGDLVLPAPDPEPPQATPEAGVSQENVTDR